MFVFNNVRLLNLEIKPHLAKYSWVLLLVCVMFANGTLAHRLHPALALQWPQQQHSAYCGPHLSPYPVQNWRIEHGQLTYSPTVSHHQTPFVSIATMGLADQHDFNLVIYGQFGGLGTHTNTANMAMLGLSLDTGLAGKPLSYHLMANGQTNHTPTPKGMVPGFTREVLINVQGIVQQNGLFTLLFQWSRPGFSKMLGSQVFANVRLSSKVGLARLIARNSPNSTATISGCFAYGTGVTIDSSRLQRPLLGCWHQHSADSLHVFAAFRAGSLPANSLTFVPQHTNKPQLARLQRPAEIATAAWPTHALPNKLTLKIYANDSLLGTVAVPTRKPKTLDSLPNLRQPPNPKAANLLWVQATDGGHLDAWHTLWDTLQQHQNNTSVCAYWQPAASLLLRTQIADTLLGRWLMPLHSEPYRWLKQTMLSWAGTQHTTTQLPWPHPAIWPQEMPHHPDSLPPQYLLVPYATETIYLRKKTVIKSWGGIWQWLYGYPLPLLHVPMYITPKVATTTQHQN